MLMDQPLPPQSRWVRDAPSRALTLSLAGSIAAEHAAGALIAAGTTGPRAAATGVPLAPGASAPLAAGISVPR